MIAKKVVSLTYRVLALSMNGKLFCFLICISFLSLYFSLLVYRVAETEHKESKSQENGGTIVVLVSLRSINFPSALSVPRSEH